MVSYLKPVNFPAAGRDENRRFIAAAGEGEQVIRPIRYDGHNGLHFYSEYKDFSLKKRLQWHGLPVLTKPRPAR